MSTVKIVSCPICESKTKQVYKIDETLIFRCPTCSHCFSFFDSSRLDKEIYRDRYYTETHVNWFENPDLRFYERIFQYIQLNPPNMALLDVGCGNGAFIKFVSNNISLNLARIVGIDLSATPLQGKVEIINADFFKYVFDVEFDYIVSLAVIEHVSDVRGFVERLKSLCAKNGQIVIMTVNEESFLYSFAKTLRFFGMRTPMERLYDAHHIHHFTTSSLEELINRTKGLVIKKRYYHNIPLKAVDLPYRSPFIRIFAKFAVCLSFILGKIFQKKTYLQTVFVQRSDA